AALWAVWQTRCSHTTMTALAAFTDSVPERTLQMQPSMFNLRVSLPTRDEVFLMNTLTDAQLVVSSDVATLLDRLQTGEPAGSFDGEAREALTLLSENGFL